MNKINDMSHSSQTEFVIALNNKTHSIDLPIIISPRNPAATEVQVIRRPTIHDTNRSSSSSINKIISKYATILKSAVDPTNTTMHSNVTQLDQIQLQQAKHQEQMTNKNTDRNETAYHHLYMGARFPNGTLGYIADPTALSRGRLRYLQQQLQQQHDSTTSSNSIVNSYWNMLMGYQVQARNGTETGEWLLGPDHVCSFGPGRGLEDDGAYKLLVEKIRIRRKLEETAATKAEHRDDDARGRASEHDSSKKPSSKKSQRPPIRVFCGVYTYPRMRDLFRTQALSWGYQCDGFLAFSTETIAALGLVDLVHEGPESYDNMWQKVRSIWIYIYHHYGRDYDFFHLGGDDLYMIMENFRSFLQNVHDTSEEGTPIFLGQWIPIGSPTSHDRSSYYYVAGAPGYTLNQKTLQLLVEKALPHCRVHFKASYEDRLITNCLRSVVGVVGQDTREQSTGEQQYHDCSPHCLYVSVAQRKRGSFHSKLMTYWQGLPHPNNNNKMYSNTSITTSTANATNRTTTVVGPKVGLQSAATYSVSFHNLHHPLYMARIHAMVYKRTCPAESPLGRALRSHLVVLQS